MDIQRNTANGKFNRNKQSDFVWVPKLYLCLFNYTVPHAQLMKFSMKYEVQRVRKQTVYFMVPFGHLPTGTKSNHKIVCFLFASLNVSATLLPNWGQWWTRWHWDRLFSKYFGVSVRITPPILCTVIRHQQNTMSPTDSNINLLTPNVNYIWHTIPLTSKVAFYIFIQQIQVLNILNMVYTLRFFLFKMQFVS